MTEAVSQGNMDHTFWIHPRSGNLITPKVMLSYSNLITPKQVKGRGPYIYGAMLLIPRTADMTVYFQEWQRICAEAMASKKFPPGKMNPATGQVEPWHGMRIPHQLVRDHRAGDGTPDMQGPPFDQFEYYISVRTYGPTSAATNIAGNPPGVMLPSGQLTTDPSEAYSGRWAVASIQGFAYNVDDYGVSWGVENVQLLEHGERIGGGKAAPETEFSMRSDVVVGNMPAPLEQEPPAAAPAPAAAPPPQYQQPVQSATPPPPAVQQQPQFTPPPGGVMPGAPAATPGPVQTPLQPNGPQPVAPGAPMTPEQMAAAGVTSTGVAHAPPATQPPLPTNPMAGLREDIPQ